MVTCPQNPLPVTPTIAPASSVASPRLPTSMRDQAQPLPSTAIATLIPLAAITSPPRPRPMVDLTPQTPTGDSVDRTTMEPRCLDLRVCLVKANSSGWPPNVCWKRERPHLPPTNQPPNRNCQPIKILRPANLTSPPGIESRREWRSLPVSVFLVEGCMSVIIVMFQFYWDCCLQIEFRGTQLQLFSIITKYSQVFYHYNQKNSTIDNDDINFSLSTNIQFFFQSIINKLLVIVLISHS